VTVHEAYVAPRPTLMRCACGAEVDVCSPCGRIFHVSDLEGSLERGRRCAKRDERGVCVPGAVVPSRSALADKKAAKKRAKKASASK
jgi:hypothetical protein